MTALIRISALSMLVFSMIVAPLSGASDRKLGVAPAPSELDVVATTWASPAAFLLPGQATSTAFMGGGISIWTCSAAVLVKDPAQTQLKTRVLFNGAAGALYQTTNNADGSQTRVYLITNPPLPQGQPICQTQLQVAKTSANIALRAAPAPPEEDIFQLSVPTPN